MRWRLDLVVEESTQNGCSNDIYAKTRRNKSILSLEGKVDKCENHEIGRVFAVGSRHHLSLSFFQFVGSTSINRREAIGNLTWELLINPRMFLGTQYLANTHPKNTELSPSSNPFTYHSSEVSTHVSHPNGHSKP